MRAQLLSAVYRKTRRSVIDHHYKQQAEKGEPRNLEPAVVTGDKWLKRLPRFISRFSIPDNIGVWFYDLYFPSPVTVSAFKGDIDIVDRWLDNGFGGACVKTVMAEEREGNKQPRIQELTHGEYDECLANRLGLPGHDVKQFVEDVRNSRLFDHGKPVGFSIGGSTIAEYKHVFDTVNAFLETERSEFQWYYEINISCPNTDEGQQMAKHPELLEELLQYMTERTDAVIGVKLSPDMSDEDLIKFAQIIGSYERTYVNLGNTTSKKRADVGLKENEMSGEPFGVSGPKLYKRTKEMVELVSREVNGLPIIATGGIDSAEKVYELQTIARRNGTHLITGMATQVVKDPYVIPQINKQLARFQRQVYA